MFVVGSGKVPTGTTRDRGVPRVTCLYLERWDDRSVRPMYTKEPSERTWVLKEDSRGRSYRPEILGGCVTQEECLLKPDLGPTARTQRGLNKVLEVSSPEVCQ